MIERFMEQYPAIQVAALDPDCKKHCQMDNLDRLSLSRPQTVKKFGRSIHDITRRFLKSVFET